MWEDCRGGGSGSVAIHRGCPGMSFGERFGVDCARAEYPLCLGLDPRVDGLPELVRRRAAEVGGGDPAVEVRSAIAHFHELAIAAAAGLVPAVKLQMAFYEQYGIAGLEALGDTIATAHRNGLLVIVDGKRNDIDSTAAAYARAYLGSTQALGRSMRAFEADALTVNPYLGWDSLVPFARVASESGTGLFVLVHTSNPSSVELQEAEDGELFLRVARYVTRLGEEFFDDSAFASVGAVVGCTFPKAAVAAREAMPCAPIVVVGYGAQAGSIEGCAACFTPRGDGAVVNASRSLTYDWEPEPNSEDEIIKTIRGRIRAAGVTIRQAVAAPRTGT
jgi:orotidine-5'-phosphate decarboxylase